MLIPGPFPVLRLSARDSRAHDTVSRPAAAAEPPIRAPAALA